MILFFTFLKPDIFNFTLLRYVIIWTLNLGKLSWPKVTKEIITKPTNLVGFVFISFVTFGQKSLPRLTVLTLEMIFEVV